MVPAQQEVLTSAGSVLVLRKFAVARMFWCFIVVCRGVSSYCIGHSFSTLTPCLSHNCCSLRLRASNSCLCFLFSSASSSSFCRSLSCCLFSISSLRLCAGLAEVCDSVPSKAPKSLWPRFRSSAAPLPITDDFRRGGDIAKVGLRASLKC